MFVRKFEGDTLEEALRSVKKELGPDAIILKTVNNKGLKSAFKKKKFEITAAISENSYIKKAKVDSVLTDDQKEKFYNSDSGHINKMINNYSTNKVVKNPPTPAQAQANQASANASYGNMGLNKVVQSLNKSTEAIAHVTNKTASKIKTSLDEFLNIEAQEEQTSNHSMDRMDSDFEDALNEEIEIEAYERPAMKAQQPRNNISEEVRSNLPRNHREEEMESSLKSQQQKIEYLENQLFELTKSIQGNSPTQDQAQIFELRKTLKTLEIDELIIQRIIKKAQFELSKEELADQDLLFEFALKNLNASIKVGMPMYSMANLANKSAITVFISEVSSGQTSMIYKLAKNCENSMVLTMNERSNESSFIEKMLNLNVIPVKNIGEIITYCKKAQEQNRKVFIDYKSNGKQVDETKKLMDALQRSFNNVEAVLSVSAIHSEIFNRKIISKYLEISKKVTISHMDLCLSFGALINLQTLSGDLEFLFYGTGAVVPEDYEVATSERILAGMFQL